MSHQVYIACLAAYNNGHLHGDWIDIAQPAENIQAEIDRLLQTSPATDEAEEWAIHDIDCQGIQNLPTDAEALAEIGAALEEHGKPFALYWNDFTQSNTSIDRAIENYQEAYLGCYESVEDYAQEILEELGITAAVEKAGLPQYYIDFKSYGNDLALNGDIHPIDNGYKETYIFRNT
jgi:antirestriction protein